LAVVIALMDPARAGGWLIGAGRDAGANEPVSALIVLLRQAPPALVCGSTSRVLQFAMHDTGMVGDVLEAYERLILDAMRGDHTLFTTAEGIERLWEVSIPLLEAPPPVRLYPPGSLGA
jgi:glucose-6-phosphate 1-dehydrogenase